MSKKSKVKEMDEVQDAKQSVDATELEQANDIQDDAVEEEETMSKEEQLQEELGKEKDKFLRLFAEFENFKKRTSKERMELFKTAGQEIMTSMLPVMDDFDRALKEIAKTEEKELLKGVELISTKFRETLKNKGLEEVAVEAGETFDAELHEAVTQIPAPDDSMKGKIIDVIEKGYKLGDRIIRHPKVVVGN
ncbi:nucleotide exchange factor GrpE [Croceivirga sp. JEA036]|uniref:nucleotide exchange factor GrpE n=1 Tax=Croceivirga sp. JEA036 TaxID=2721162 RepID=UPI00143CAC77|nr:nucleotide exchange factor GrpE [Croceivirga sp. JEA036]NJB37466.1 nucleotide exchange factor GrpE [Croceivirga sp. JEA036]